MSSPSSPAKASKAHGVFIFCVWFAIVGAFCACLVALHAVPLPATTVADTTHSGTWRATHALGSDCGCSSAVAAALLTRGPRAGWTEHVFVVGQDPDLVRQLTEAGFSAESVSPSAFTRRTGLQGAPWLALHTPDGKTVYSGGYAPSRPGIDARTLFDTTIMDRVRNGQKVPPYPSFGCAISRELRARLDPLSLK